MPGPDAAEPPDASRAPDPARSTRVPRALRLSATASAVEAAALVLFAVARLVIVLVDRLGNLGPVAATAVVLGLLSLALGFAARALWRGRRGGRAPALVGHLLVFGIAGTVAPVGALAVVVKVGLAAVAVAGAVGLLLPSSTRALAAPRGREPVTAGAPPDRPAEQRRRAPSGRRR